MLGLNPEPETFKGSALRPVEADKELGNDGRTRPERSTGGLDLEFGV